MPMSGSVAESVASAVPGQGSARESLDARKRVLHVMHGVPAGGAGIGLVTAGADLAVRTLYALVAIDSPVRDMHSNPVPSERGKQGESAQCIHGVIVPDALDALICRVISALARSANRCAALLRGWEDRRL